MSHSHTVLNSNGVKNGDHSGSYQSMISTTTSSGTLNGPASSRASHSGTANLRPMEYLTSQQRKHNVLVVSLLCIFVALLCGLALWWILRVESEHADVPILDDAWSNNEYVPASTASRNERRQFAQQAMDQLNRRTSLYAVEAKCECTLMVIRHCEKLGADEDDNSDDSIIEQGDKHCSYLGFERASFLPTLFDANTTNENATSGSTRRWPAPSRLYALSTDRNAHANYREWETLVPLSKSVGVDIELVQKGNHFAAQHFFPQLQRGELCGRLVVVSWKHSLIPSLVNSVGCGPDNGCPDAYPENSFDQVWQLKFVFDPPTLEFGHANAGTTVPDDTTGHRQLKHHHHRSSGYDSVVDTAPTSQWAVYASVTQQWFDPLAYSKSVGDYNAATGSSAGGRWWNAEL